jgi:hypothetical protein
VTDEIGRDQVVEARPILLVDGFDEAADEGFVVLGRGAKILANGFHKPGFGRSISCMLTGQASLP